MIVNDASPDGRFALGMRMAGQGAGPSNVTMAGGVQSVATFVEGPAGAGMDFTESEVIGGNILVTTREPFLGNGKLVHESEAEVVLFGSEVYFHETAGELAGGFPANLTAKAGFVSRALD